MSLLQTHYQWTGVCAIYQTLRANGHQAFLAGGCVRDALIGRRPKDLDIATSATPEEIELLFPKTIGVGKAFGVIRVLTDGVDIEVATFRQDGKYADGRHPESIAFSTPEEDAKRRDFTVNALFLDPGIEAVLDFVEGKKDLEAKLLRAVGNASERFAEDYLRVLRGVRFTGQLGFELEKETFMAMQETAKKVVEVSAERILEEMTKLLTSEFIDRALENLCAIGLMKILFSFREKNFSFLAIPTRTPWKLWVIFFLPLIESSDSNKTSEKLADYLNKLRFSNRDKKFISLCFEVLRNPRRYFSKRLGERLQLYALESTRWACEILCYQNSEFLPAIEWDQQKWLEMGSFLPHPFLQGSDVLGKLQGQKIGKCLRLAFIDQLEGLIQSHTEALKWLEENYG